MGRHQKYVFDDTGLDKRKTGYYSTPSFIGEYLAERLLSLKPDAKTVLDPCIGKGELTHFFENKDLEVTGIDTINFNPKSADNFIHGDFLDIAKNHILQGTKFAADVLIANPPYNCHELEYLQEKKGLYSTIFGKHTVLNMYSLFLTAMIRTAEEGAIIGLIVSDSFLSARGHEKLRKEIVKNCKVHELLLCPSDVFLSQGADVRTCILVLEKVSTNDDYTVKTLNRVPSSKVFKDKIKCRTVRADCT